MANMNNADRAGKTDGRLFEVRQADLVPGATLRMVNGDGSSWSFPDCLIVEVRPAIEKGEVPTLVMARPRAVTNEVTKGVYMTHELLEVEVSRVLAKDSQFRSVVNSRGDVAKHIL